MSIIRFDGLPPEVMQAMCTPMHQILSPQPLSSHPHAHHQHPSSLPTKTGGLYLGSLAATLEPQALHANHITHIVQVLDVPWMPLSEKDGFNCYRIDIVDIPTADLKPHLEGACDHIDMAIKSGHSVLVHCQQGVSRSAAIVIAYLIHNLNMSFDAALALVTRKRPCVKPNSGFVKCLQDWEGHWRANGNRRPQAFRSYTTGAPGSGPGGYGHGPAPGSGSGYGRPGMMRSNTGGNY